MSMIKWMATIFASVIVGIILNATLYNIILPAPEISITDPDPSKNISVPICGKVTGGYSGFWGWFYSGIGSGLRSSFGPYMWVVVNSESTDSGGNSWWPQYGRITPWNNTWHVNNICLGGPDQSGKEYDIAIVLLNKNDNQYFENYITITDAAKKTFGIHLPETARIVAKITVKNGGYYTPKPD